MLAAYAGITWNTQEAILAQSRKGGCCENIGGSSIEKGLLWTDQSFTELFLLSIKTVLLRFCVNKTYEICKYYLQYHPDLKIV